MAEEDADMEALRRKKMEQTYAQAQNRVAQEEQLRSALGQVLEPKAYERLMLVKMSSPELFSKAVQAISYLQQAGQLKSRLSEGQLRAVLAKLAGARKEGSITIMRKGGDDSKSRGEQSAANETDASGKGAAMSRMEG